MTRMGEGIANKGKKLLSRMQAWWHNLGGKPDMPATNFGKATKPAAPAPVVEQPSLLQRIKASDAGKESDKQTSLAGYAAGLPR